ncbi:hypothetical protein ACFYO2_05440 [Streptomyces sp. NPDC006602]
MKEKVDVPKSVASGQYLLIAPHLHDAVRESAMVCPAAAVDLAES